MAVVRSPQTDLDLEDIWLYVAERSGSEETADRLIDTIVNRFLLLGQYPNLGRSRSEGRPRRTTFSPSKNESRFERACSLNDKAAM